MQDVGEHDAAAAEAARQAEQQMARRRERQARVGLLRNTNRPPPPPMRRPPLIGRHLVLRSSRRPKPAPEPAEMAADIAADLPLIDAEAGRISRIDVDRLARMAESLAGAPRPRPGYADRVLGGAAPAPAAEGGAEAPSDPPDPAESSEARPGPAFEPQAPDGWRAVLARWLGRG